MKILWTNTEDTHTYFNIVLNQTFQLSIKATGKSGKLELTSKRVHLGCGVSREARGFSGFLQVDTGAYNPRSHYIFMEHIL